jgi:trans-aconitate methyltransferase
VSDRERLFSTLLDVVEAMAGAAPTVVDLACGPGSITSRLLDAGFPQAGVVWRSGSAAVIAAVR